MKERLGESGTTSSRSESEDAEPEPGQLCLQNQAGLTKNAKKL